MAEYNVQLTEQQAQEHPYLAQALAEKAARRAAWLAEQGITDEGPKMPAFRSGINRYNLPRSTTRRSR